MPDVVKVYEYTCPFPKELESNALDVDVLEPAPFGHALEVSDWVHSVAV